VHRNNYRNNRLFFSSLVAIISSLLVLSVHAAWDDQPQLGHSLTPLPKPVPAPDFTLADMDDEMHSFKDLRGKVVLLNFWATWCPPCVHEMPSMQRLSEKLTGDPFVILGVNIAEDQSTVENFLQTKINVDFPILMDTAGNALRQWNVMAFPTSFVIDKQGKMRYALFGSIDWDTAEIVNKIETLVKEK